MNVCEILRVFGLVLLALLMGWKSNISMEAYNKITEGMTRQQVEAILGGPPRWETEAEDWRDELVARAFTRKYSAHWYGRDGVVDVLYTPQGTVAFKQFRNVPFRTKALPLGQVLFPWTRQVRFLE